MNRFTIALTLCSAFLLRGQPKPSAPSSNIEVIHVRGNVYMFASDFGNATVQVGEHRDNDGAFMVDTGSTETAPKLLAELQKLTKKPLRYVVNTSANVEHLAGNDATRACPAHNYL
jgi:glyoxylase-like metal-dependent hydrolase (beta-lactamase superfamily II)